MQFTGTSFWQQVEASLCRQVGQGIATLTIYLGIAYRGCVPGERRRAPNLDLAGIEDCAALSPEGTLSNKDRQRRQIEQQPRRVDECGAPKLKCCQMALSQTHLSRYLLYIIFRAYCRTGLELSTTYDM